MNSAVERAFREESGRVLATLIRHLGGDFQLAEDALQDAFAVALVTWPRDGEPANAGAFVSGEPLESPTTATTVAVRNGDRVVTDGPFAETKEWLGGYYVIEAADLDAALDHASRIPNAGYGHVEVRPVMQVPGM